MKKQLNYAHAIREGFLYLLTKYPNVFTIGQGLWSPWYVGNSMNDLDKLFGKDRVIDTPVSELACTGMAIGASISGFRPIVIHPRIDFMLLAVDQIVNQAAKWRHMFGGKVSPKVTIRGIINRGGEQGAQHSQSLHSWFAHIPGLKVVMPASVADARDLLISSVLSDDPVLYIDDRWLYEEEDSVAKDIVEVPLEKIQPKVLLEGNDVTFVASGYSVKLCLEAAKILKNKSIYAEVIDLRIINPLNISNILKSVKKTRAVLAVDGGWSNCGLAGEIIAKICESLPTSVLLSKPQRITLTDAPAPSSSYLENLYYSTVDDVVCRAEIMVHQKNKECIL